MRKETQCHGCCISRICNVTVCIGIWGATAMEIHLCGALFTYYCRGEYKVNIPHFKQLNKNTCMRCRAFFPRSDNPSIDAGEVVRCIDLPFSRMLTSLPRLDRNCVERTAHVLFIAVEQNRTGRNTVAPYAMHICRVHDHLH